jgi:tetratricopeptide (TPR) repeat protein
LKTRVAIVLLSLAASSGCRKDARPLVAAGDRLFQQNRLEAAVLEYRKALQKDPRYGEAYYRLGLAEMQLGDGSAALGALVEAASLLPGREDVGSHLADTLLLSYLKSPETGREVYQKLNDISGHLLAKNPNSYNGWRIKGYIAFLDKKPVEAASALAKANAARPFDPELVASLSQALFQIGRNPEGEKLASELIARKPDAAAVYDVLYRFYISAGRIREGEDLLRKKCANNPTRPEYVIDLAFHYLRAGDSRAVAATLNSLVGREAEFPNARLYVGDFYAKSRDWDNAIRTYTEGAGHHSQDKTIYNKRAVTILLQIGRLEQARTLIDSLLREFPHDIETHTYHARMLFLTEKPDDLKECIKELQLLVEVSPRDENLHFELGRAYHRHAELDRAWSEFQRAVRLRSDFVPGLLALAEISQEKNQPDQTLRFANDVLWFAPGDREARLLRCLGLIGTGHNDEAGLALRALLKIYPQDRNARLQLGLLDIWEKNFDEAEALFKSVHQPGSRDTAGLEGLIETYAAHNRLDKAVAMLQQETQPPQTPVEVRKLLARTAVRAGNYPVAIAAYKRLVEMNPGAVEYQVALGETYSEAGNAANALEVLEKAQQMAPSDPQPLRSWGAALIRAGRKEEAIAIYRKLLALVPDDLGGLNNLAFLLAETQGGAKEAVALAQRARQKSPDSASVADTLGWAFLKQGSLDSAIQVFNMLVEKYPGQPVYHYHLGAAFLQRGWKDLALTELQTALDQHPLKEDEDKIRGLLAVIVAGGKIG